MHVLDAGCGVGLEAARLANAFPETRVTAIDRNPELLEVARDRSDDVEWIEADLTELPFPDRTFDAVRTERVLMYQANGALDTALDHLIRTLKPNGRLALYELDYGATILAPANRVAERTLYESLPEPLAGRRLPGLLAQRGLQDVAATPMSFAVNEPVWRKIIKDTVTAHATGDVEAWLDEQQRIVADGGFVAAFTGILTSARKRHEPPGRGRLGH
jgi:SAM-dependent methyltransferase